MLRIATIGLKDKHPKCVCKIQILLQMYETGRWISLWEACSICSPAVYTYQEVRNEQGDEKRMRSKHKRHALKKQPKWLKRSLALMLSLTLAATNFATMSREVHAADSENSAITTSDGLSVKEYGIEGFAIDPGLMLEEDVLTEAGLAELDGASVMIGNVKPTDKLIFDPVGNIKGVYKESTGILNLTGKATVDEYQSALRSVRFSTKSTDVTAREITFTLGSALSFAGHFYEYITKDTAFTWQEARDDAASKSYFGRQGYMVTITSQEENNFVKDKIEGLGWIGAADIVRLKNSGGPAANGGDWRWVTGPEGLEDGGNGLAFWQGYIDKSPAGTIGPVGNMYNSWQRNNGKQTEPNDSKNVEYVAHIYTSGEWNDYNPTTPYMTVKGYIIEYGGMENDKEFTISAKKTVEDPLSVDLKITAPSGNPAQVNVPVPEITGELRVGSTVKVVIKDKDGKVIDAGGDAAVLSDGTWTFKPAKKLTPGEYTIEAQATDGTKVATKTQQMNVVLPAPELKTAELKHTVQDGNSIVLTFDQEVELTSPKKEGFTITISGNEIMVNDDNFMIEPSNPKQLLITLPEDTDVAQKEVKVIYTATGNLKGTNGTPVAGFTVEALAVTIDQPDGKVFVSRPAISGTATLGSQVTITYKDKDGTEVTKTVDVDADGKWRYKPTTDFKEGDTLITAIVEKDGKTSEPVKKTVTVDTEKPTATIDRPNGKVFVAKPEISGTATPESKVTIAYTDKDGKPFEETVDVGLDGKWNYTPTTDLAEGETLITVVVEKDGKISEPVKKAVTVDTSTSTTVDKSALEAKISDMDGKLENGNLKAEDYTTESWQALQDALKKAKEVFANLNATKEQVDQAKSALDNAEKNLVKIGGELKDWELVGLTEGGTKDIKVSPEFNPNQYKHYTATVTNDVYGISLNPTVENSNGTQVKVYVNGTKYPAEQWSKLPLNVGENNLVQVKVEDTAGNLINDYTIEITHEGSPAANNKLGSLVPSTGSLYPEFNPDTASYTMSVTNSVYQIQFKPAAQNPNAKIEIRVGANGKPQALTSGEFSGDLDLNPGSNDIYVLVTDENNVSKEYKITVYRAYSNGSDNGGSSGGSSSGGTVTTSPSTGTGTVSKPLDLATTVNGQQVTFATGTVTQAGDRTQTTVTVDAGKLSGVLVGGKGQKLSINVPNNGDLTVQGLTAQQLKELKDSGSSLEIGNLLAIYPLPAGQLNLNRIASQFGNASLSDIAVNVNIKRTSNELNQLAREVATKHGYELLVHPVDLDLSFTQGGQTIKAGKQNSYAAKYIALPEGVDPSRITTGVIVNPDGSVFHVPTVVTKINNRYFARINDMRGSGTYSVIWNPKNYDDVMNHWAKASANDIGARLVIEGTGNNTFTPNRDINRSEFAVFIVKGLGLMRQDVEQNAFRDVPSSTWYHAAVTIASEFGIVLGYDDGAFHGEEYITREQGMAMIARAYRLIRPEASVNTEQMNAVLSGYADGNKVSNWAKEAVALLISEGISEGSNGQLLKPQAKMTRAEAAAMIQRLLKTTGLID